MASGRVGDLMRGDHSRMSNCPLSPFPSLSLFLGSRQKVSGDRALGGGGSRKKLVRWGESVAVQRHVGVGVIGVLSRWDVLKLLPRNP